MRRILLLNRVSPDGLESLPSEDYIVSTEVSNPDAIIVRSFDMHGFRVPDSVKVIGRAGTGVNNIPLNEMTERGIPVFNAPGANANAVTEIVIASLIGGARKLSPALDFVKSLEGDDGAIEKAVEKEKKAFVGIEIAGRTLAVVGLGKIGLKVARAAQALGMDVRGYDPSLTPEGMSRVCMEKIKLVRTLGELVDQAHFLTVHVPLTEVTRDMIGPSELVLMNNQGIVLNFARHGIVNEDAVISALDSGRLGRYVSDFPQGRARCHPKCETYPHLGASTVESEIKCAQMVAERIHKYLNDPTHDVTGAVNEAGLRALQKTA